MDLVVVCAIADERGDEVGTFDWLKMVSQINQKYWPKLTRRSCTAPQKHVAVALPSGCTPFAPSEGNGMLELPIVAMVMRICLENDVYVHFVVLLLN